jgi:hypothetical protein
VGQRETPEQIHQWNDYLARSEGKAAAKRRVAAGRVIMFPYPTAGIGRKSSAKQFSPLAQRVLAGRLLGLSISPFTNRLQRLIGLLRLVVVLWKVSTRSGNRVRMLDRDGRLILAQAIERSQAVLPLRVVLGFLRLRLLISELADRRWH